MTVPVWMLLGFAVWTALLLLFTIGIYRWSRILSGRVLESSSSRTLELHNNRLQ